MAVNAPVFLGDTYTTTINSLSSGAMFGRTSGGVWLPALVGATGALIVASAAGGEDVNLVGINGAAPVVGHGVAAAALRVELPTDGTGVIAGVTTVTTVTNAGDAGPYSYSRKTADGQVKATAGYLHTVSVTPTGTVTAGVLTLYDNAAETGTVIISFSLPITSFTPFSVQIDASFANGLYVGFDATLANVGCTVSYR